jgi:ELWxxDGT repeat protein
MLEAGATFASGKVGQAFSLDGVDDRIRVPNSDALNLAQGFSIEAWIFSNNTTGQRVIASKWNDDTAQHSYILKENSDSLRIELQGENNIRLADASGATSITVGQWTHVAVTYDTQMVKLFLNGTQDASISLNPSQLLWASAADLLIGATGSGIAENFSGLIDEVSLYSRALSAAEIQSIHQAGSDGKVKLSAMTVIGSSPAAGAASPHQPTDFVIDFSFPYDTASIQPNKFTVNGRAADSFVAMDADSITFRFNSSPVTVAGTQTIVLGAGAVTASVAGVSKPSLAAWTTTFRAPAAQQLPIDSRVVDLTPGSESSFAASFQVVNNTAYFNYRAINESVSTLWKTDGTFGGTSKVPNSLDIAQFGSDTINVNGTAFFFARPSGSSTTQLWKIDATSGVATVVRDSVSGGTDFLGSVGTTVFFVARHSQLGDQLWRSDGTAAGTFMLSDVNPSGRQSRKDDILYKRGVISNDRLYFLADGDSLPYDLWVSDGTPQGTAKLFGSDPMGPFPFTNSAITALNGYVYFRGRDGADRTGLWRTDGTATGPSLFNEQAIPIAAVMGRLFYSTSDELWATDGTANGTALLKKLTVTSPLVQVNGSVFFAANDGVLGNALWKTDGTAAGTVMVKVIGGSSPSNITTLTNVNGRLFFAANDGVTGTELWVSDGTEAGTKFADLNPGSGSSSPGNFLSVNGRLIFTADDGVHGNELWVGSSTINSGPTARNSQATAVQEISLPIALDAADFDNDPLTYTVVSPPQHGTLSGTAPNLVYSPAAQYTGPDSFTFRANDGKEDSNLATVAITVISNAPVVQNVTARTKYDKAVNLTLTASDPRSLPLTYTVTSSPLHGTLSGAAPNLIYTPATGYIGPDNFTYQVNNGQSSSNTATVSIDVTPNQPPVADDVFLVGVSAHKPSVVRVSASDPDGDSLTYVIVQQPRSGTIVQEGGQLVYKPGPIPDVEASFTYQASDGEALSNVATAIVLLSQYKVTVYAEDGAQAIDGTGQALFAGVPPGGSPDLTFTTSNDQQTLFTQQPKIDSTGTLKFTPAPNAQGKTVVTAVLHTGAEGEESSNDGDLTAFFEIEIEQRAPWQNDNYWADTNDNGDVTARDVLLVIDYINGIGITPAGDDSSGPYYDTSGDNRVTAFDALSVINIINAFGTFIDYEERPDADLPDMPRSGPEGEAVIPQAATYANQVDSDLFALLATDLAELAAVRKRRI